MPGPLKRSVHRDTAVDDKIGELFPNIMFSKRADGLRAGKRKRSRGPSPPINNRSRLDDSDHGDKDTNDGTGAPASMSQKHNPPSSVQPSSEQKVARTLRSSPILDGTQAMMLGTPPKKMLERATATGYAPTEGSSRGTQTISDAHISSRPTMSNRTYSGAFSPNPGADFEVPRAPFAPDSSTAGPSDGSKHSKS